MKSRLIVNGLSISRIAIALAFVLFFQRRPIFFSLSVALIALAIITDLLDGFLARHLGVASIRGRLWDSLGDKAIYTAVIIAFNSQGLLIPILSWGLVMREVALYITRVLYIEKLPMIERIRPFTNWHGYFMHAVIVLGFLSMYTTIHGHPLNLYLYMQIAGGLALVFGIASIIHWLNLE